MLARDGSESPPATTLKFGDEEDPWTTKSKKPKMTMYADTVGEKSHVKNRIFANIQRRVPNKARTEIYEEETSEPELEDFSDAREKLKRIQVTKAHSFDTAPMGDSARLFKKSNIRDRLGQKSYDGYQSGDSLERDDGADLGPLNLSDDKIQIRVTHSDNEEEIRPKNRNNRGGRESEAMEEDGNEGANDRRDLDLRDRQRRKSPAPRDLRSKITSEVVKIKTEKGEDEKRLRENRYKKFVKSR